MPLLSQQPAEVVGITPHLDGSAVRVRQSDDHYRVHGRGRVSCSLYFA